MRKYGLRRSVLFGITLAGLLIFAPAYGRAADRGAGRAPQGEAMTQEVESLLGPAVGSAHEAPVFTDLGGGFYTVFIPLSPEMQERFLEASSLERDKAQSSLTVISVGQAPTTPPTPVTTTHGALSDTTFPYTYWIITLNLGSKTVTKSTTLKLTGPGLKFNSSAAVVYGANGIWGVGYRPGVGVGVPGVYTLQGSVSGAGSITTKTFAVNP
jgi:hypothetical protein